MRKSEIETKHKCPICGTENKAVLVWTGNKYLAQIKKCKNINCITNKLN